jgi:HAD superfamily phosphoserine phosphatase-like hydrolase
LYKFIFDLDGTITKLETLPLIAKQFNVEAEIEKLTRETINGNIPFIESFIRRVYILGKLPVSEIDNLLDKVPLYQRVFDFIKENKSDCIIATGNLRCWIEKLCEKIGCTLFCSDAIVKGNSVNKITNILRKESVVKHFQDAGEKVVFLGDGNNDMEAMRIADISIATGMTHWPAPSVLEITDYSVFSEDALCRQLNLLL